MVDDAARPGIDDEEHHRLFMLLLRAATASRMRDDDFAHQQEIAATLTEDDMSDRAAVARGATLLHRAWGNANEARTKLRYAWHEFFRRFDVLLLVGRCGGIENTSLISLTSEERRARPHMIQP
jgi:amidase